VDCIREADVLRKVPLLSGLGTSELKLLAFTSQLLCFSPGDILMQRGDPADCAYVILEGEVEVLGVTSAGEFVVGVMGANTIVGEIGVLNEAPRSATVRAKGRVQVLRISSEVFLRLASERPDRALHVMRELSEIITHNLHSIQALKDELQKAQAARHDAIGVR
jgi:CRP-like cAMP-binding protein